MVVTFPSHTHLLFGPVVKKDMSCKIVLSRAVAALCSIEQNHLGNHGSGLYEEHFCEIILNLCQCFRRRCRLIYLLSTAPADILFGGAEPFRQFWSRGLGKTSLWNYLEFGPVVQEEMSFKYIPYLELWWSSCSAERDLLDNFDRKHYEKHFCEIILNWTSSSGGDVV